MNQNKIVAFLMASIVAISIVAIAMPALGSEDMAMVTEKPEIVIDEPPCPEPEPKKPEELDEIEPEVREPDPRVNPVFRDAVIVYFNEMPASLDEFASDYSVKLIFVKEKIKMAAFETEPISLPGETSQRTLDFVEAVSNEKAYEDGFLFVSPNEVYTPEPEIEYPKDHPKPFVPYCGVHVQFWRLPPSPEEFASMYGAKLVSISDFSSEFSLSATFETDDITGFINKISTDPYVRRAFPTSCCADVCGAVVTGWLDDNDQQRGPKKMAQRRHITQKLGNTRKAATSIKDNTKVLTAVHKKTSAVKVMDISERQGRALYKYPQKNKEVL
jgi:hypothetical protein